MKRLHLIRHAKSSWDHPGLSDIERPLNKRGINDTGIMAKPILDAGCTFEAVFCSAAKRARMTIDHIAGHLPDMDINPQVDDALYTFNSGTLLNWIHELSGDFSDVTIIGHNPAFTDLANRLTGSAIMNVPTCGYVQMEFDGAWEDLDTGAATLKEFITPKMVKP